MRMGDRTRGFLRGLPDAPRLDRLIARIDDLAKQFCKEYRSVSTLAPTTTSSFPNFHQLQSCEICAHASESLWNFVSKYQYEIIVGLDARRRFLSHASVDLKVVETICVVLESRHHTCWLANRDVRLGENYMAAIVNALRDCKLMVLVFSDNANRSDEITKELALASKYKKSRDLCARR
jgi:hypothetical protein